MGKGKNKQRRKERRAAKRQKQRFAVSETAQNALGAIRENLHYHQLNETSFAEERDAADQQR